MAQDLKTIFVRLEEYKSKRRELKNRYRDALSVHGEYQSALDDLEVLKVKKKKIEIGVQSDFKEEFDQLEGLKLHIASDSQLLSDLAINQLVKGELVKIIDDNQTEYEPQFSVKFKKMK
ncbi:MAG: hypothetical protein NT165_02740 [Candidatus Falkowbacteria bacterium]|nr:hypothetical protein [Candidatus Falkowbacteria bacterium]